MEGEVGRKRGVKRVDWRRVCGEYFRLDLTALSDEVRLLGGGDNYMK
ncbi:hypothetical protein [Bartonella sp. TT67HLJMS]